MPPPVARWVGPAAARGKYDRTAEALAKEAQVPKHAQEERQRRVGRARHHLQPVPGREEDRQAWAKDRGRHGRQRDRFARPPRGQAGPEIRKRQVKDAERRQNDELAPEGSEILYGGKTTWGTLFYYTTPDGDVWIKKVGVIGRLSEFHVEFEQQATGATARQGRGGSRTARLPTPR